MRIKVMTSYILVFLFLFGKANAQSIQQMDALNYYVDFVNASSHGLGIALLITEGLNCDVLEAQGKTCEQSVRITVKDIPTNLFDKPDDNSVFYKITPIELSQIAEKESVILQEKTSRQLNKKVERAVFILNEVNKLLYKLSNLKETANLKKKKSAEEFYKHLETMQKLFGQFKLIKSEIIDLVQSSFPSPESKLYPVLIQYRNYTSELLDAVLDGQLSIDDKKVNNYELVTNNVLTTLNSIKDAIGKEYPVFDEQISEFDNKSKFLRKLLDTYNVEKINVEDNEHIRFNAKYYNRMIKTSINQTGPGIVTIFKEILNFLSIKGINFDEKIVSYKVLYPSK